jgi:DNA-binding CsgD family transcriptional regulator
MDDIFVGRRSQLALLGAILDDVRRSVPRLVVIEGQPGIGKTALVQQFVSNLDHVRVLRATGEELETRLGYGIVKQLLSGIGRPVSDRPTTPDIGAHAKADPLTIGAGVIDFLGHLQHDSPVVIVVDDAQWADLSSLHALTFALRHLHAVRVLALIATRDVAGGLPGSLQRLLAAQTGTLVRLGGLDVTELRTLAIAIGAEPLSARVAARLRDHTDGSPLYGRALLAELPAEALRAEELLVAPRSFAMLTRARLAACPPDVQHLAAAVAVLGPRCSLQLASQLATITQPLAALEHAIAAHLLEEQGSATGRMVAFPHPLVRAAVYQDLGPARRTALHLAAVPLVWGESALRHRVAAASGTDPVLAAEITAAARQQAAAGEWPAASDGLVAAARLSSTKARREQLLLEAVEWLLLGGCTADARALADELGTSGDGARERYVLGRLALVAGRRADAEVLLADAWDSCDLRAEGPLGARVAGQLAQLGLVQAHGSRAVAWACRALVAAPPGMATDTVNEANLLDWLLLGLGISGRAREGLGLVDALPDPFPLERRPGQPDGLLGRGVLRLWTDDLTAARRDLAAAVGAYRRLGPVHASLLAWAQLAIVEYRLGTWDDAAAHAELAVSAAEDANQAWLLPFLYSVATWVPAARGDWTLAEAHAWAATDAARILRDEGGTAYAAVATAQIAAARNDCQAVAVAVAPILSLTHRDDINEPGILPWRELYADALIVSGRVDEAEAMLTALETRAAACTHRSSLAAAARVRGNLESVRRNPGLAKAAFRASLAHIEQLGMPFDRARIEVAYGGFLRRTGKRAAAAAQFAAACQRFASLGAHPYLERCERELAACGATWASGQPKEIPSLTTQELAVARLVADGRTNRETARELVLSVKTVEYHLSNIYAKVGITSRTQLAGKLQQD